MRNECYHAQTKVVPLVNYTAALMTGLTINGAYHADSLLATGVSSLQWLVCDPIGRSPLHRIRRIHKQSSITNHEEFVNYLNKVRGKV